MRQHQPPALYWLLLCAALLLGHQRTYAQQLSNFGARAAGMANAAAALPDLWALGNNPAAMAGLQQPQVGVYVENRFGERAFSTVALQGVYPTHGYGTFGLSLSRFGDALFSQQHVGLGAAHSIGTFSLGAKADVWQVQAAGYGSQKAVALSAGVYGQLAPQLFFGTFAYNLNQARLSSFEDERLPTVMKAGMAYQPTPRLTLVAETEKHIDHAADLRAGVEYALLARKFLLRSGFGTLTHQLSFGAGFRARQLQVDYAFGSFTPLGSSHHLSVSYPFERATAK
ncbi:hypothetical protein ACXYMU_03645 [Pontibacter sp. CAU 1760]